MSAPSNIDLRIKKMYDLGMSPEQIAESEEIDLLEVKASLSINSGLYKENTSADGPAPEHGYTHDERAEMKEIILSIARGAEDERLRYNAARYVRDDSEGRLDQVPANLKRAFAGVSITVFSEQHAKALEAMARSKALPLPQNMSVAESERKVRGTNVSEPQPIDV